MDYPTPLPDFSRLALAGSFQLAGRTCTLQISTVQRFVDYGPDFDVLHLQVLLDGQPLALADLNALDLARAERMIAGTARSMGISVLEEGVNGHQP